MKQLEFGVIITIIAFAFFYFRLAWVRGKRKRLRREKALQVKKQGKGNKAPIEENKPGYEITSWVLVAISAILILAGMAARSMTGLPVVFQEYWWVGTTVGAILFAFCFK